MNISMPTYILNNRSKIEFLLRHSMYSFFLTNDPQKYTQPVDICLCSSFEDKRGIEIIISKSYL